MENRLDDIAIENLWEELIDTSFRETEWDRILEDDWHIFKKGTEQKEILKWFDKNHSKGVKYLLTEYVETWLR